MTTDRLRLIGIKNKWNLRKFTLEGSKKVEVVYKVTLRDFEFVSVNGQTVNAEKISFKTGKKIPFMIPINGGKVPAYIEVTSVFGKITSCRFVIENEVVHLEGHFMTRAEPAVAVEEKDFKNFNRIPHLPSILFIGYSILFSALIGKAGDYRMDFGHHSEVFLKVFPILAVLSLIISFGDNTFNQIISTKSFYLRTGWRRRAQIIFNNFLLAVGLTFLSWPGLMVANFSSATFEMVKGPVLKTRIYKDDGLVKIEFDGRSVELPVDRCMAHQLQEGNSFEMPAIRGRLNRHYLPKDEIQISNLNSYYAENVTDLEWIRQHHITSALISKDMPWLDSISQKWREQCASGNAKACRVSSYYYRESKSPLYPEFLNKACVGGDMSGCYGIYLLETSNQIQKVDMMEKIFSVCSERPATCLCYWSDFKKVMSPERVEKQIEVLCKSSDERTCRYVKKY